MDSMAGKIYAIGCHDCDWVIFFISILTQVQYVLANEFLFTEDVNKAISYL